MNHNKKKHFDLLKYSQKLEKEEKHIFLNYVNIQLE